MRLVWMSDPRLGEKVQCCKCYGMEVRRVEKQVRQMKVRLSRGR